MIRWLNGSSQKVPRSQILPKADARGPNWTGAKIAEAFSCRAQTVESLRKRLLTEGFRAALDSSPYLPKAWVGDAVCRRKRVPPTTSSSALAFEHHEAPNVVKTYRIRLQRHKDLSRQLARLRNVPLDGYSGRRSTSASVPASCGPKRTSVEYVVEWVGWEPARDHDRRGGIFG